MNNIKEQIYNYDNLNENDITETIIRVKVLLINSKKEILVGLCHNTYQFLGGHLEYGENLIDCINREIKEETGVELNIQEAKPFYIIKHYNKNYNDTGENRCSCIYYYIVNTDKAYNLENSNYTENEKDGDFKLKYINLDKVEQVLINSIPSNKINEVIVPEMLMVLEEYKKTNKEN